MNQPARFLSLLCLLPVLPCAGTGAPLIEAPSLQQDNSMEAPPDRDFLRVATWNIEWFPAVQRNGTQQNAQWQTAAVVNLIQEFKPDILAVQEMKDQNSLNLINKNLGSRGFTYSACTLYGSDNKNPPKIPMPNIQQDGLLSRVPWEAVHELDFMSLPPGPDHPVRGWLVARFAYKGLSFTLINGHLAAGAPAKKPDQPPSESSRRTAAIEELQHELDRLNLDPYRDKIIILGDFNTDYFDSAYQNDPTFKKLASLGFQHSWGTHVRRETITRPAQTGGGATDATLDYIWFSSGWGETLPSAQVLAKGAAKRSGVMGGDEPGLASDHYPVWVDIPLPGK